MKVILHPHAYTIVDVDGVPGVMVSSGVNRWLDGRAPEVVISKDLRRYKSDTTVWVDVPWWIVGVLWFLGFVR